MAGLTSDPTKIDEYLASPKSFHLEMPLYHKIDLTAPAIATRVHQLLSFDDNIDAYCVWCEKESVFGVSDRTTWSFSGWIGSAGFNEMSFYCTRVNSHKYYQYYYKDEEAIQKIGQYPSVADFQIPQALKYRKILGDEKYKELTRGIGLFANGVGIGAFVYLRRIFESLIEEAHEVAFKSDKQFPEKKYLDSRMEEKISILSNHLPKFLVDNKALYSILNKGVHELSEEECLKFFVSVRIGIEQILDEKIIEEEKLAKSKLARELVQEAIKLVKSSK